MSSSDFAQQMLLIGSVSTFDASKLSDGTLRSIRSHIKTLKRNNIPITEQSLTLNTVHMLDSLVDIHGKPLTSGYKRQIGMSIKRMYPENNISLTAYNEDRKRKSNTRLSSDEFVRDISRMRDHSVEIIAMINTRNVIDDLGMYDACLGILLTISTSLRLNEILQLKLAHIPKIKANEPIGIKSKSSDDVRFIAPNELLLNIFTTIERNRELVHKNIDFKKSDNITRAQQMRFDAKYLVISSADYMRKKLHELAASLGINLRVLGFNVFRKHITTVLSENGGHFIAQTLNNHSSINTTMDHYNVVTPQAVQTTFDGLVNSFSALNGPIAMETNPEATIKQQLKSEQLKAEQRLKSEQLKAEQRLKSEQLRSEQQLKSEQSTSTSSNIESISKLTELHVRYGKVLDVATKLFETSQYQIAQFIQSKNANDGSYDPIEDGNKLMDIFNQENQMIKTINDMLTKDIAQARSISAYNELDALFMYRKQFDTMIISNDQQRALFGQPTLTNTTTLPLMTPNTDRLNVEQTMSVLNQKF